MNPAQLLNPKAFAKEQAKSNLKPKKKTPNYGEYSPYQTLHSLAFVTCN